jgi:hypothetical protein
MRPENSRDWNAARCPAALLVCTDFHSSVLEKLVEFVCDLIREQQHGTAGVNALSFLKRQGVCWDFLMSSRNTLNGKDRRLSVQVRTIKGTPLESLPFRGIHTGADCR